MSIFIFILCYNVNGDVMELVKDFKDYEIISMSKGEKLERWGKYYFLRPDPEIIWEEEMNLSKLDAHYHRNKSGGGYWEYLNNVPENFTINYKDLKFNVKLMGFKHTGIFPEQSINWDYVREKIKKEKRTIKVLNLFGYTGCASVACLSENAEVVHVDASKGTIDLCKENVKLNHFEDRKIRYIVDDCVKFVERELRRGNKYDAIIMDPPSFGRGSNKEVWDINKDLFNLVSLCSKILSDDPIFVLINTYTTGLSKTVIENVLALTVGKKYQGKITSYELGIKGRDNLILPCGETCRWEKI